MRVRPHAKTHKCPEVGKRQIALGAVGMCCQKVSEAEAMVDGGITDVLVSQRDRRRAEARAPRRAVAPRAASACASTTPTTCATSPPPGRKLDVYIEIDVGMSRCGVAPGEPAVALAREIAALPESALRRPAGLPRPRAAHPQHGRAPRGDRDARRSTSAIPRSCWRRPASPARSSPARAAAPSCSRSRRAPGTRSSPAPTRSWTSTTRATNGRRRCRASSTRCSSSAP